MCDCHVPQTPAFAKPIRATYTPAADWDPLFDPATSSIGTEPLVLIPDSFKTRSDLLSAPAPIGSLDELRQLFSYKEFERERKCADICAQNVPVIAELFAPVLNASAKTWTPILIGFVDHDMLRIVLFQKKIYFNRARPYQIYPDLTPPFTPGHPSYPGGHAAQSQAIAAVIELILQPYGSTYARLIQQCKDLAVDIARNREVAGLHYPSDTDAGKALAGLFIVEALKSEKFNGLLTEARKEWQP